ncbi:MAG: hypothetical protein ACOCXQ_04755, partial [Patescibacteria group bacterium]
TLCILPQGGALRFGTREIQNILSQQMDRRTFLKRFITTSGVVGLSGCSKEVRMPPERSTVQAEQQKRENIRDMRPTPSTQRIDQVEESKISYGMLERVPDWHDELRTLEQRGLNEQNVSHISFYTAPVWSRIEELFPFDATNFATIISQNPEGSLLGYRQERRDAIDRYLERFYSHLNEIQCPFYRGNIDVHQMYWWAFEKADELANIGNPMPAEGLYLDHPQIRNLIVLMKHGYMVDGLLVGNPLPYLDQTIPEEYVSSNLGMLQYQPVTDTSGLADYYRILHKTILAEVPDDKRNNLSFVYGNEPFYSSNIHLRESTIPIIHPSQYWTNFFHLHQRLSNFGITLKAPALALQNISDGDVWLEEFLRLRSLFGKNEIGLRGNLYLEERSIAEYIEHIRNISEYAASFGSGLTELQEFGILPWDTSNDDFALSRDSRSDLIPQLIRAVQKLDLESASVYSQPFQGPTMQKHLSDRLKQQFMSIHTANIEHKLVYDNISYLHRDEDPDEYNDLWQVIVQSVNSS